MYLLRREIGRRPMFNGDKRIALAVGMAESPAVVRHFGKYSVWIKS